MTNINTIIGNQWGVVGRRREVDDVILGHLPVDCKSSSKDWGVLVADMSHCLPGEGGDACSDQFSQTPRHYTQPLDDPTTLRVVLALAATTLPPGGWSPGVPAAGGSAHLCG